MTNYRKAKKLSPEIAAYIAGLIDGEGTITLSRRHANENRQLVISIANTELGLLEFVATATGVGKITRKRTVSTKHSPSFTYSVSNQQALDLLHQVTEYLRSYKKHRAQLVLSHYALLTARNGKYSQELRQRRAEFEAEFLRITAATMQTTCLACV